MLGDQDIDFVLRMVHVGKPAERCWKSFPVEMWTEGANREMELFAGEIIGPADFLRMSWDPLEWLELTCPWMSASRPELTP